MNNKITIIEGPTPVFERLSGDPDHKEELSWAVGILEGPFLYDTFLTTLRTFDSNKLLERCKATWEARQTMFLEYKDEIGLRKEDLHHCSPGTHRGRRRHAALVGPARTRQ